MIWIFRKKIIKFLGQEHLVLGSILELLMDAFLVMESNFSLFGKNLREINKTIIQNYWLFLNFVHSMDKKWKEKCLNLNNALNFYTPRQKLVLEF